MEMKSNSIYFRPVKVADAEFILNIRTDKRYNNYLSSVDDDLSKQIKWLEEYKEKEKQEKEYYYIIHRNSDSLPIGTVRIYDFLSNNDSFSWGSWILNENKTKYAALECAILIYDFAFLKLGFKRCHMDIRKGNTKVIEFHKKFGVKIIGETHQDYLGHYYPSDYLLIKNDIKKVIDSNNLNNLLKSL